MKFFNLRSLALSILMACISLTVYAQESRIGFMVIAPDRGFMGNQEIRDLYQGFEEQYNSSLVFITEENTDRYLTEGLNRIREAGAEELVVIPMFISDDQRLYTLAKKRLEQSGMPDMPVEFTQTMYQSYLTAEILHDRIMEVSENQVNESLVVLTTGVDASEAEEAEKDLRYLLSLNNGRYQFKDEYVIALEGRNGRSPESREKLSDVLTSIREEGNTPVVVIADMAQKLDGMMAFAPAIGSVVREHNGRFNGEDLTPHPVSELWLNKQANLFKEVNAENLGVIVMPHGSDYNWNRRMMDAIQELQDDYMIEYAFSMGDAELTRRAAMRLEKRGATAITVLRVFSLESSFKAGIEYTLGLRDQMGHGGMMMPGMGMPQRIISSSRFYTTGGLEDSPLFAEALLDRALELSENPEKETVILVGHGTRTEAGNKRWLKNLESITAHMRMKAEEKGYDFRDFKFENWREDWPDLREERIANVRNMVKEAEKNGGTAIVIPARTTEGGHAEKWLGDLNFRHNGKGFAPHPLFVEWVEGLIKESIEYFNSDTGEAQYTQVSEAGSHQHSGH